MTELLEFISGLLDAAALVALSLSLGGIACTLVVLRPIHDQDPVVRFASDALLKVSVLSTCAVAGLRVLQLALKALALSDALGFLGWQVFMQTRLFRFGALGLLLILGVAGSVAWVRRDVSRRLPWSVLLLVTVLFMMNEAWLSHAASRLENQGPLMVATMAHVCGATVWAGGVVHVVLLGMMTRTRHADRWPHVVARFSPLGMGCVGLIVGPGTFLWWHYVGGWAGLIGTGYGNMLLVKIVLFVCVLALAIVNLLAVRQWAKGKSHDTRLQASGTGLFSRVPAYLEVEALLAGALLFTAVSLTGFPPSVDVTKETVTLSDISVMYAPKSPHLRGPERLFIEAPQLTDLRSGEMGKKEDVIGGMIMLTHSHGVLERKEEFLIQSTHVSIGVLAVLMRCARWLEIRLPSPYNRLAGLLSLLATLLVGFILLFYMKPDPLVA